MAEPADGTGEPAGTGGSRSRVAFAVGLGAILIVLVVVLVATSGGESVETEAAAAPTECVESWNADKAARSDGRHNRVFHRYTEAQVGYLDVGGGSTQVSSDPGAGACTIVFPRDSLDPEAFAAGYAQVGGDWVALSESFDTNALASLQAAAIGAANADIAVNGTLTAQ